MKTFISLFIFLIGFAHADELPSDVKNLLEKRNTAVSAIDKRLVEELEKLKVNYTRRGDLDAANSIVELINKYNPDPTAKKNAASEAVKDKLVGKWFIYDTVQPHVWRGIITINEDLTYTSNNKGVGLDRGKYKLKEDDTVMSIGPYLFDITTIDSGKILTTNAGPRTMERIKE